MPVATTSSTRSDIWKGGRSSPQLDWSNGSNRVYGLLRLNSILSGLSFRKRLGTVHTLPEQTAFGWFGFNLNFLRGMSCRQHEGTLHLPAFYTAKWCDKLYMRSNFCHVRYTHVKSLQAFHIWCGLSLALHFCHRARAI